MSINVRRVEILLTTILLAVLAFLVGKIDRMDKADFSFQWIEKSNFEQIQPWTDNKGDIFVFLPSYVELSKLLLRSNYQVTIGDITLEDGDSCKEIKLNFRYPIGNGTNLTFMRSANISAMYIDTVSGSMKRLHEGKRGTEDIGNLRLYTKNGSLNYSGGLASIKLRGNSTFKAEKKAYSIELGKKGNLLNMGAAEKWILLANAFDSTNIRNKMVFDFAQDVGLKYSPESEWVDLYLNGEYAGLYLLCERNEIHPERVALSNDSGVLVSKDELDRFVSKGNPYILTDAQVPLRIHNSSIGEEKIRCVFQSVENAILAEDGFDRVTGKHWMDLIDVDSWIKKYLVEEIFGGIDAGHLSQYFYFNNGDRSGGKVFAGPVWDYDDVLPSKTWWVPIIPEMMYAHRIENPWFHALYKNEMFYAQMKVLYQEDIKVLVEKLMQEKIPVWVSIISSAAEMNRVRWNGENSKIAATEMLESLIQRKNFLDKIWITEQKYDPITIFYWFGDKTRSFDYYVLPGSSMPREFLDNKLEFYDAETGKPLELGAPAKKDMQLHAYRLNS